MGLSALRDEGASLSNLDVRLEVAELKAKLQVLNAERERMIDKIGELHQRVVDSKKQGFKDGTAAAARVCDNLSVLYPRTDVGFDAGYTMGVTRAGDIIKQLVPNTGNVEG